jgi:hypothetical protein
MVFKNRFQRGLWLRLNSNIVDFLGEYEAICETALGHESGPYRWGWLTKKTEGRKTRATVPLMNITQLQYWTPYLMSSVALGGDV